MILNINELACSRGDRVLFEGVNTTLNASELLQVTGCNGSGKTSFLRALLGFLKPEKGAIQWSEEASIIYLGHHNAVKQELTVLENLRYQFLIPEALLKHVDEVLSQLRLLPYAHTLCRRLSQGQKQKVALARLWLLPADVWILDEPFTALDHATIELLELFFLQKLTSGLAIIATTHRPFLLTELKAHMKMLAL